MTQTSYNGFQRGQRTSMNNKKTRIECVIILREKNTPEVQNLLFNQAQNRTDDSCRLCHHNMRVWNCVLSLSWWNTSRESALERAAHRSPSIVFTLLICGSFAVSAPLTILHSWNDRYDNADKDIRQVTIGSFVRNVWYSNEVSFYVVDFCTCSSVMHKIVRTSNGEGAKKLGHVDTVKSQMVRISETTTALSDYW